MKHLQTITIRGEPNAQKRHKHHVLGKFAQVYDPSAKAKEDYRVVLQQEAPPKPYETPLFVCIDCFFAHPKSHYGTGKNADKLKPGLSKYHTKKPDPDNVAKFALDALNGVYWADDSIICHLRVTKHYSEIPRTIIAIWDLNGKDETEAAQ